MAVQHLASPDAYAVYEDGVLDVAAAGALANDDDVNGDPLSAAIVAGAAHCTVTLAVDGSFRYVPAPDFHGPDAFTYRASDGTLFSGETAVSLSVSPVPDAPVAAADAYQVETSVTLRVAAEGVLANDSDADGDPLEAVLAAAPEHGSVDLSSDGSFVYSSARGYVGQDVFTYRALDGALVSDDTAVTITVAAAAAHPPVAAAGAFTTLQAQPLEIAVPGVLANDSDPDGALLGWRGGAEAEPRGLRPPVVGAEGDPVRYRNSLNR